MSGKTPTSGKPTGSLKDHWSQNVAASSTDLTREQCAVIWHCRPRPGLSVLELGCGTASLGRELARLGCQVTAIDFAQQMIDAAVRLPGGDRVEFIPADVLSLSLERRFDRIVGTSFLHEIPHPEFPALAGWLAAHLADEGQIIFVENSFFNPIFRWVRRNLVDRGLLRKVGSFDETPFDAARYAILANQFGYVDRRIDTFNLFRRAFGQFLSHIRLLEWTVALGTLIDAALGMLPPHNRFSLAWSFQQTIMAAQVPFPPTTGRAASAGRHRAPPSKSPSQ